MRRAALALGVALTCAACGAAAADPAKPADAHAEAQANAAWAARLAEARARLLSARERAAASERALARARHRDYPRGEAFAALVTAAADARKALAAAEAELPALLEEARRAGVEPGVLRELESEAPDEPGA